MDQKRHNHPKRVEESCKVVVGLVDTVRLGKATSGAMFDSPLV